MFNDEVKKLLIQVVSSWQVIVVTVILVIYISIVNSVARTYRGSRPRQISMRSKKKSGTSDAAAAGPALSDSVDLDLEEETTDE
jgi:uncharacterized membrane protein YqiK